MDTPYRRGDIVLVDLEPAAGSEPGKTRPCVIVQNDIANRYSPVANIVPLTKAEHIKKWYPCVVSLGKDEDGLTADSAVLCNQIRTIDVKRRVKRGLGHVGRQKMIEIDEALRTHLGI